MSIMAARIEEHWRKYLPAAYAQLTDQAAFFADQGAEAERQMFELADALAGDHPPGEEYMQTVGRLNEARRTVESTVLRELLPEAESEAQ